MSLQYDQFLVKNGIAGHGHNHRGPEFDTLAQASHESALVFRFFSFPLNG